MSPTIQSNQFAQLNNGIRLHFASAGERGKPLILFAHGFPEFWYEWHMQLAEFGGEYFAVAPDLRGFNLSDKPTDISAYKAKHIVDDLRLLIEQLGYEKCILVAHDWGGAIAWNVAITLPQLLHKLIIINSPHPYLFMQALLNDDNQKASSEYMNSLRVEGSEVALVKNNFAKLERFFNGMGQPPAIWFNEEVRAKYHACWSLGLTGSVNYYRASPLHPPTAAHAGPRGLMLNPEDFHIRVPTRVIWGERDIALPKTLLNGLDALVDDLEIQRIAEGSHWVVHEQPGRINQILHDFLSR